MNNLRAKAKTQCLGLERFEFFFGVGLQDDFCLTGAFPLFEDGVEGGREGGGEGAVAGEGCVGGLGGDFSCLGT